MVTPRVGDSGVGTTVGDLYVVDENGDLERLPKGTEEQVLITRLGATGPSGTVIDLAWEDLSKVSRATVWGDATDAVFQRIDLGGGPIPNPSTKRRGTHPVLAYDDTTVEGIPWQRVMDQIYSGDDMTLSIYWVADGVTTGDVVWASAFERNEAGHNVDTDAFAALQTAAAVTAPGTNGDIAVSTIAFTQAQADAVAAGDPFRLFIQRTADAVEDTMAADAQLVRWALIEDAA